MRRFQSGCASAGLIACLVACLGAVACSANEPNEPDVSATPAPTTVTPPASGEPTAVPPDEPPPVAPAPLELHLAFVHGVLDPEGYGNAHGSLVDFETAVVGRVLARKPEYESTHRVKLTFSSVRVNLYTDLDGNPAGTDDGSQEQVAENWRNQLAKKLSAAFPGGERNIVVIGHSTGARAAVELAADVGGSTGAIGTGNRGFSDRIAGVVSIHGMIDAINRYATIGGIVPFSVACPVAKKSGWCAYAGNVSAVAAADWVATQRRSLVLTSAVTDDRCGVLAWKEPSDQLLPARAQGNPSAVGLGVQTDRDGIFRPAHGIPYGEFCHSDITNRGSPRHADAVDSATARVETWLFDSAPRVVNAAADTQSYDTKVLAGLTSSEPFSFGTPCSPKASFSGPLAVVGNCHHPGSNDGDDHAMTAEQLVVSADGKCGGTVAWKNIHDHPHSGTVWFKAYEVEAPAGLLPTLH